MCVCVCVCVSIIIDLKLKTFNIHSIRGLEDFSYCIQYKDSPKHIKNSEEKKFGHVHGKRKTMDSIKYKN